MRHTPRPFAVAAAVRRPWRPGVPFLLVGTAIVLNLLLSARAYPSAPAGYTDVAALPPALSGTAVEHGEGAAVLRSGVRELAATLFASLGDPDPEMGELADGVAMGVFVDLAKLSRTSSLGRYLAEQLMTEFQQHGFQVVEIRKSRSILIRRRRGEYGLSRDPDEIAPEVAARALVTGTYTVAGGEVLVNARVVDNKTAALLASATVSLPMNATVRVLLADSASASSRRGGEVTYMKRLE